MAGLTAGISDDGVTDKRRVAAAINSFREGNIKVLKMHSDDYIRRYASDDDFEFWESEKRRVRDVEAAV